MFALLAIALAQPLHLEEAFARARDRDPDVRAARESVRAAGAAVETAGQLINPTVGVSVGPDEPTISGTLEVKLPFLGQRQTAITAAERDVVAVRADAEARQIASRARVRRAYAALAAAQVRARLGEDAAELASNLATRARAKVQAGLAPELEAVQADVLRRRARQDAADKAAALAGAREEVGRLIAADAGTLEAADPLLPVPQVPLLDELLAKCERHPEVRTFAAQREAALARATRDRVALVPVPDVSLELEKLQDRVGPGLRAGVAFELPLLSWNGGRVHEAQAQAALASVQAEGALSRRRSELRAARARYEAASRRAEAFANDLVPASRRLVGMARDAWELGRAPLTTLLQAQTDLTVTQAEGTDAALAAWQAVADLEEAAGAEL